MKGTNEPTIIETMQQRLAVECGRGRETNGAYFLLGVALWGRLQDELDERRKWTYDPHPLGTRDDPVTFYFQNGPAHVERDERLSPNAIEMHLPKKDAQAMKRVPVSSEAVVKVRLRIYEQLEDWMEDAIEAGWSRAHKHADNPKPEDIKAKIFESVMTGLCEFFIFEPEEE